MKIGVLAAGSTPPKLVSEFGSDGNMFRRMLGPAFKLQGFDVTAGVFPREDDDCEAYLINGSSAAVYDNDPWIRDLETFVQARIGSKPMVGICFGHQLIAKALGGEVIKSPKGWGLGLHRYEVTVKAPWMSDAGPFALPASHQDQVVALGPDARAVGGNDFSPFALIDYPGLRAMSLQAHPEFDPEYAKALIALRRGKEIDEAVADAAIANLDEPNDRSRVTMWLRRFLNTP